MLYYKDGEKTMKTTFNLHFIKDQSMTKNNVYVIVDKETKKAAIIDPGCSIEQINELFIMYKLELDAVLITHTHPDHIRCVNELVDQYKCRVYVSRVESEYYSFSCKQIQLFDDNDVVIIGKTRIECLLTPGHTLGSTCFLVGKSLFTGDTIFIEGCGVCTARGGSAESMFHSIQKIKIQLDENVLIYPAHTYSIIPGKSIAYLKEYNIYFCIDEEKAFVDFRMRKNQKGLYTFT